MKKSCRAMAYQRVETMLRNQTAIERAVDEARAEQRGGEGNQQGQGFHFHRLEADDSMFATGVQL